MANYLVLFSFDGTNYYGTQKQTKFPSITEAFEKVLFGIYQEQIKFYCCSRLDRRVHGLNVGGNFVVKNDDKMKNKDMVYVLNRLLPEDIRVKEIKIVGDDFHSRYDAINKTYLYKIDTTKIFSPFRLNYYFHSFFDIDIKKLQNVCKVFIGKHDFYSFSTGEENENTLLELEDIKVEVLKDSLFIRIKGKKFLRYMVRYIVGSMLEYAYGHTSIEEIKRRLESHDRTRNRYKVPPQGLYLEDVEFDLKRSLDAKI